MYECRLNVKTTKNDVKNSAENIWEFNFGQPVAPSILRLVNFNREKPKPAIPIHVNKLMKLKTATKFRWINCTKRIAQKMNKILSEKTFGFIWFGFWVNSLLLQHSSWANLSHPLWGFGDHNQCRCSCVTYSGRSFHRTSLLRYFVLCCVYRWSLFS